MPDFLDHTITLFKSIKPHIHFYQKLRGSPKVLFVALVSLLLLLGVAYANHRYGNLLTGKLGQKSPSGTVKVSLLDAFSGQAIPNVTVRVYSDNGMRCVMAPCKTEVQEWNGRSDNHGFILIPSKIINKVTTISATGYKSGRDLNEDSEKVADDHWVIELDPDSKIDNFERRLKLVDSQTQKPISDSSVWITNSQNCQPLECADYSFSGETNKLGNVYYPPSAVKDNSWIFVKGYKSKQLPVGWVNFKVSLDKAAASGGESPPEPPEKEKPSFSGVEASCYEQVGVCKCRSNRLGFEIDFPTGFDASEADGNLFIRRVPPSGWTGRGAENFINIAKFSKNSQDEDLLKLETLSIGETAVTNPLLPSGFTYKRIADVTVSGIKCKVFENLNPWETGGGVRGKRVHIPTQDGTIVVSGLIEGSGEQVEPWYISEETFDQILSTFRFLDQEVSQPPGWKAHLFTQYNLEFKYPPKWDLNCPYFTASCSLTSPGTEVDHGLFVQGHRGAYMYISAEGKQARRNYSTLKGAVEFYVKQDKYSPSEKKINNIDGYELAKENHAIFIFENDDYFLHVSWIPLGADDPLKGDLDNVLSSFRFLD